MKKGNSLSLRKVLSLNINDKMNKLIITTSFSGVIMKNDPWEKAHKVWFEHYAKKLNKPEIAKYAKKENWFNFVDEVMEIAEPKLDETLRTIIAREKYFKIICDLGCDNPNFKNKEIDEYLYSLKEKFSLGLITTTPQITINKILSALKIENLFDYVECSRIEEKDDKVIVFKRFIEKNEKPILYFGGERKEIINFCKENNIDFVSSINKLKETISSL